MVCVKISQTMLTELTCLEAKAVVHVSEAANDKRQLIILNKTTNEYSQVVNDLVHCSL